ncbi:MAG: hypothetical protein WCA46_29130 [Actinocatenispora sp.]
MTMILPALTEATSPVFRPIKYSLFPPLDWPRWPVISATTTRYASGTSTSNRCASTTTAPTWW